MVRYTVAVCNYNMAETVGESLRSILEQIDSRFEVVCVDGGSTDGSQSVLEDLSKEYEQLRVDLQDPDPNRHLGADRNRSFELANGDYVLESFDCDNYYYDIIDDFVKLYHQFESGVNKEFLLSAMGINMAPRTLALQVPYRNLGGAEDRDWFRRLAARDAVLWVKRTTHIADLIGYEKNMRRKIRRDVNGKICDIQSGITLWSTVKWALSPDHPYIYERRRPLHQEVIKRIYDILTYPYAYCQAQNKPQYMAPKGFTQKGDLERTIAHHRKLAPELADELGIELDCSRLSPLGRRAFCGSE